MRTGAGDWEADCELRTNLEYARKLAGSIGMLGMTFTHSDSNLPIYSYDKWQVSVSVRKKW